MRVLLAVPVRDSMPTATAKSLCAAVKAGYDVMFATASPLPVARNAALRGAREQGYKAVLFVDSDMVFVPEHVRALLDVVETHPNTWIVSARYYNREPGNHKPHAYTRVGEGQYRAVQGTPALGQLEPVDYSGAGFLYIDLRILDSIPEPWFDHGVARGEDAYFCLKAKEYGVQTWYYPYVTVGHVGTTMYSDPQYEAVLKRT